MGVRNERDNNKNNNNKTAMKRRKDLFNLILAFN